MKKYHFTIILGLLLFLNSCKNEEKVTQQKDTTPLEMAEKQLSLQLIEAQKANKIPRAISAEGDMHWAKSNFDWTEGFFPGSLWYLYKNTKDDKWKSAAETFQATFEDHKYRTNSHDLGFIFNASYANGYELTKNPEFSSVMITAADSLITRFNPTIGSIQSWDVEGGWQSERGWKFPVIIDNMMNLELLFKVSELTENEKYKKIAIAHANTTLKNHFRADNSSYHVVDYDPETGNARKKETAQGFANESAWARGQAWGLYGYVVCYRYTKDEAYLNQAKKIAKFISDNKPADGIPYWDYNASKIPNEPRDVSAAAITASALIELDGFTTNSYLPAIDQILNSLATKEYTAVIGENHNFILKHSVGSIPHGFEIDVPINYADYYYLEALLRYKAKYQTL